MSDKEKITSIKQTPNSDDEGNKAFYEKKGASRAITSGMFVFVSNILGSLLLWGFLIIGTGTGGLEYCVLATSIGSLFLTFSSGFSASFIARIKDISIKNPEKTDYYIGSYSKILILISIILTIFGTGACFLIQDSYTRICLIFSIPQIMVGYLSGIMVNLLNVNNRYDVSGVIGGFYGIVTFVTGYFFIFIFHVPDMYYALIPFVTGITSLLITIILFKKFTHYKFFRLLKHGNVFNAESKDFVKYSILTTITSLDILSVFGNIIIFITAIVLGFVVPESVRLSYMQIFAIVSGYAMGRVIIFFFAGPLNVEIAEATTNKDLNLAKDTINKMGKITLLLGLSLMVGISAFSKTILTYLHHSAFINANNSFNYSLLDMTVIFFIISTFGQFLYAFSSFFANALIGSGHAKKSAKGFGLVLLLVLILTPIFVYYFDLIGAALVMLITACVLLPYMLYHVRKTFQMSTDFRILRQIPYLIIIGVFLFLFPVGNVFGLLIDLLLVIGVSIAILTVSLPFFGVIDEDDYGFLEDILNSFKLMIFRNPVIKFNKFLLRLNPLNKKLLKNEEKGSIKKES